MTTTYIAENIETGEVIGGGARDLARKLGVAPRYILNAVSKKQRVRRMWYITKDVMADKTRYCIPVTLVEEWDRVTAPFKALSASKRGIKRGNAKIRLRTMYNVGVY